MPSIFTRIIVGEIPCYKVAENEAYFAFLDINPLVKGHTLVVPKQEVDYLFDLEDDTLSGLYCFAKRVAIGMQSVIPCKRVGTMVIGTEVPHAHVHLLPFQEEKAFDITRPRLSFSPEEFEAIARSIRESITF